MAAVARPHFYKVLAVALALFAVIGFSRTYYLRPLFDLPPLTTLVQLHGLVFTAWLAVFIVQTRLVAAHRVDLHMKLGAAAVALAILIVTVGFATVAVKANEPRIHPSGLTPPQFTVVGLFSLGLFAVFIASGLALRRRAGLHKRFMVLAMIATLTPPSSRIIGMLGLREHWSYLVPILPTLFIGWCLVHDWVKHRVVHPVFAIGGVAIVVAWPLRLLIGRMEWYQPVGQWIARIGERI
ncbi:MAG TPA: hypothetical protein VM146_10210 [Steroidobacteraceae bacterium]|nr:hypothetical protein [Steroidobacteraceae bacterium]